MTVLGNTRLFLLRAGVPAMALLILVTILSPGRADAAVLDVIHDCIQHDQLTTTYPLKELQAAKRNLSQEVREYTDCAAAIQRAIDTYGTSAGEQGVHADQPDLDDLVALAGSSGGTTIAGDKVDPTAGGTGGKTSKDTEKLSNALGAPAGAVAMPLIGTKLGRSLPAPVFSVLISLAALAMIALVLAGRRRFTRNALSHRRP